MMTFNDDTGKYGVDPNQYCIRCLNRDCKCALIPPVIALNPANPKTLMGRLKLPILTVVPPSSIIGEAEAMRYGAFEAPRADGTKGYGPFNWRDQTIEAMTYIDAAHRHMFAWVDGEEVASDSLVHHLKHAKATLGILLDAIAIGKWQDDRPKVPGTAAAMLEKAKQK